jgi:Zn-dependent peptidase ImmA (M78 family)
MSTNWDRLAALYGVEVFEAPEEALPFMRTHKGTYVPEMRAILIFAGLEGEEREKVLAHEFGHVVLGHLPTGDLAVRARQEAEANAWAAERLAESL